MFSSVKAAGLAAAFVTVFAASSAFADVTLIATQTANISAHTPDTPNPGGFNNRNLTVNHVDDGAYNYGLLQFDLSGITSSVTSATLTLDHTANQASLQFGLYPVTSAWDQDTATYNDAPAISYAAAATFDVASTDPERSLIDIDLTDLVNDWISGNTPNYGLALKVRYATNPYLYFAAVDGLDSGYHPQFGPRLTLAGVDGGTGGVPEPATWALMILGLGATGAGVRRARLRPA